MASTDACPSLHDQQNHPSTAATSTSMEMPPTDMDPPTNHPTMLPTEPPGAMDPTTDDLIYINPHLEGARPTTYTRMLEEFTEQNPSPEDRWCDELYKILKMESDNIRSGTHCISDLPELAIRTITYSYPTFMGGMKRVASCRTDYDKEEKGGRIGEDWDDLKGVEFYIVPDNSVEEEATDDSKYYSTPPAAVTVNQGEELCPSAQSNTICTFPKPTTPTSSPPVVEIASESAPAVEAQPTMTLQVSGPSPQHAQDATVETTEGLTFTYDFSLFQDRSWLALTVEEASNALSSTPPSHPHYAANLNQALQHAESSLRLFPSFLRLIPLMSICRILSLQGNQARADFVQSEGLAIHTEGKRVFTLMSSSRLHEERSSSTQEAEHLETAITYMTNELATQSGKERSLLLLFLSCMHNYRFIATQEAVDLDMAIEYLAEMTGINADPKHQRILARYYVARYDISKDLTDLEAATAAIEATLSHAKESTVCSDVALRAEVAHQKWLHTDWKYHVRAAINWSMAVVEYLDNEEDIVWGNSQC